MAEAAFAGGVGVAAHRKHACCVFRNYLQCSHVVQRRGALPETPQFVIYFIFNQFRKLLLWPTFSWFSTCVSRAGIRLQAKPQLKNLGSGHFSREGICSSTHRTLYFSKTSKGR